jgi:hypothetical protein
VSFLLQNTVVIPYLILQVDASLKDPSFKDLNLNESPNWSGSKCHEDLERISTARLLIMLKERVKFT